MEIQERNIADIQNLGCSQLLSSTDAICTDTRNGESGDIRQATDTVLVLLDRNIYVLRQALLISGVDAVG
jgi:hypothetical protein